MKGKAITRKIFLKQMSLSLGALGTGIFFSESLSAAGLFNGKTSAPKNILVLGAGLAGLAAAWELQKAGHNVKILEARNRPGGRVSTLRKPFADGLYAEEGAAAFSATYTYANKLIEEFGLEKIPWAMPEEPVTYFLNGKKFEVAPGEVVEWPFDLTAEEQELGPMGIIKKYIIDTLPPEIVNSEQWDQGALLQLDQISLQEYLLEQGASEGAVNLIKNTQWFGAVPNQTSGLSMAISDFGLFMGGAPFILAGGNDKLPAAMAERMSDVIEYGIEVNRLVEDENGVTVTATKNKNPVVFEGDEVIMTFPIKVVEKIKFVPPLPAAKQEALKNMPVLNITRSFLEVDEPFWQSRGVSGIAFTDLPIGQVNAYLNQKDATNNPALLESFVAGPQAALLGKLPDEEVLRETRQEMQKLYPELEQHYQKGYVKAWSADPYALGGPTWPAPGDVTNYLTDLQMPHGKIHFAGEGTSILRSTMEGALRSGVRAANEVNSES